MHGVEKKIEVPVQITIADGHSIISSDFTVRLEDYNIEAPSLVAFVKMSEEVAVSLGFTMQHMHKGKEK